MRPALADAWNELRAEATRARPTVAQRGNVPPPETWLRYGVGIDGSSPPGEFRIEPEGDRFVTRLLPAGIHSNLLVASDGAVLHSPRFIVENDSIRLLVALPPNSSSKELSLPIFLTASATVLPLPTSASTA